MYSYFNSLSNYNSLFDFNSCIFLCMHKYDITLKVGVVK